MLVHESLVAIPVSCEDAQRAVQSWLKEDAQGFGLSKSVESAVSYDADEVSADIKPMLRFFKVGVEMR